MVKWTNLNLYWLHKNHKVTTNLEGIKRKWYKNSGKPTISCNSGNEWLDVKLSKNSHIWGEEVRSVDSF